jgi:hypothetical protein
MSLDMFSDGLNAVDRVRAQRLGEELLRRLRTLPVNDWHHVSMKAVHRNDGGVLVYDIEAVKQEGK